MRVKNFGEVNEPGEVGDGVVSVVGDGVGVASVHVGVVRALELR